MNEDVSQAFPDVPNPDFDPKRKAEFYAKIDKKMLDLIKQGEIYLNHAPHFQKYALCKEIRTLTLEMYKLLIEAEKRYWNKTSLTKLDVVHEQLRRLWRTFYLCGFFDYHKEANSYNKERALRRFTCINIMMNEIGKMIGGLIKNARSGEKI